jgi:sulfur relay (sulfurtransferase) DsrF/TusC family protein
MVESVVIITDQSSIGKNSAVEAIRIGSGFVALGEIIGCKVVFTGDAVDFLNKNADPTTVGLDSASETIEMAELSDLELFVIATSLEDAGLTAGDLIEYENLKIINLDELADLIEEADVCFRF